MGQIHFGFYAININHILPKSIIIVYVSSVFRGISLLCLYLLFEQGLLLLLDLRLRLLFYLLLNHNPSLGQHKIYPAPLYHSTQTLWKKKSIGLITFPLMHDTDILSLAIFGEFIAVWYLNLAIEMSLSL